MKKHCWCSTELDRDQSHKLYLFQERSRISPVPWVLRKWRTSHSLTAFLCLSSLQWCSKRYINVRILFAQRTS